MAFFVAMNITSGVTLYEGYSPEDAAKHLIPGTCYATSPDKTTARDKARAELMRFRKERRLQHAASGEQSAGEERESVNSNR